ncbi:hypothetical protein FA15DRAFT_559461, partial [Coprinopsis marcescibilis]
VQLLRDCKTHWSSTFNMIHQFLILYPAIQNFLNQSSDLQDLDFKSDEIQILEEIISILEVTHQAQELLSFEQTPTLSLMLPVYQVIINAWRIQCNNYTHLQHFIKAGICKIEEKYIPMMKKTHAYAIAMTVNPAIKLSWTKE